jgi:hypothetical protein
MKAKRMVTLMLIASLCASRDLASDETNEHLFGRPLWGRGVTRARKGSQKRTRERDWPNVWDDELLKDPKAFRQAYRMTIPSFNKLLDKLRPDLETINKIQARRSSGSPILPEMRLSMTLRYYAGGSAHDIIRYHKVSKPEFYKSLWRTTAAINKHLDNIKLPMDDDAELQKISNGFYKASNYVIEHCVGAIDGVAIQIRRPLPWESKAPSKYFNRKGYYSLCMITVCDADLRIRFNSLQCAGSTHDSLAYTVCPLARSLKAGRLPSKYFIVGDDAFTNTDQLITPYPGRGLSAAKDNCNYYQSRCRTPIERTFGVLFQRWGLFQRRLTLSPHKAVAVTRACVRLHNFCIDEKDTPIDEGLSEWTPQGEVVRKTRTCPPQEMDKPHSLDATLFVT